MQLIAWIVCLGLFGFVPTASAQSGLSGTVVDSSGAAVPGALVFIERGLQRREAITDAAGGFAVHGLPPGPVRLTVTLSGFRPQVTDLVIGDATTEVRITLEPAPFVDTVTVSPDGRTYRPTSATTTTRMDLPGLETPQAVSVVTARVVQDRQVVRMAELADNVAGVRASPGYGGLSSGN